MSVLVSQFICPPTAKNTLLCIRMNHGFCGSGIWMQWEGLVSVWCQSGEPEAGETSASGAGTWAGMGGRLGSAGTLGQSASQVASASGWTFHCSSVLLWAKGNLHGLYDPTSKVAWHHSCCTLLVNALTSPLARKGGSVARPSMGGHQMLWSC